jgi:predicted PurR-regulated permease PerM
MPAETSAGRATPVQGGALRMVLILAAVGLLGLLAWRLADVLLLALGSILVAVLLNALAEPLVSRLRLRRPVALSLAVTAFLGLIGVCLWFFGQQITVQAGALEALLPRAWAALQLDLAHSTLGTYVLDDLQRLRHADGLIVSLGSRLVSGSASFAAASVIVFFAGLYLAYHPATYLGGLLKLAPPANRARVAEVLGACGLALNRWMIGQLISMVLVGFTVGVGLWLVGAPSPLALGLLAGLGQFVPVVGPMVTAAPGLIIAAAVGPQTFAWTCAVYVGAMQFEANVFTPLLLRQMVELPMAVTLFAVLAMGVLLGPLGVLFATPLAVIAYVVVRMVYVEGLLGETPDTPAAS